MEAELMANLSAGIVIALILVGGICFALGEWYERKKHYSDD